MKKNKTKIIPLNNPVEKINQSLEQKGVKKRISQIYFDSLKEIDELLEKRLKDNSLS